MHNAEFNERFFKKLKNRSFLQIGIIQTVNGDE
jgi:hypothetical protein